jgi:sulfatase modifying factor 1
MGDMMGVAGALNDKADITAPVRSYEPNDFGLYNMAGNVNEWTADTYRQLTYEDFDGLNPFRGNEYTTKRLADPAKGQLAKDPKYGRAISDPSKSNKKQPWPELIAQNQNKAAGTTGATGTTGNTTTGSKFDPSLAGKPYSPDQRGYNDTVSNALYGHTTLVNNRSKVYKGGSWNDMAYWLNPSTRRFMDQSDASAEVGFRCAMTNVGAAEINPNGKTHIPVKNPAQYKPR